MSLDEHAIRRLESLAADEVGEFVRLLSRTRNGNDRAVHKARKSLQKLRAVLRLLAPLDPEFALRENAHLRTLRRRLSTLRDAAARAETFRLLAARPAWSDHAAAVRTLAGREMQQHRGHWASYPPDSDFWNKLDAAALQLQARVSEWPFVRLTSDVMSRALKRARKQANSRIEAARGHHSRELRHELRRKLRRYANMRRAAAVAQQLEDPQVKQLLALAKRCGHEGDLWMAGVSARSAAKTSPEFKPVALDLELSRREQCQKHDAALRRAHCFRE